MAKTDIEKAFRIIPISPHDHHLLGFSFQGKYYFDTNLPMGLKSSCQIFETFSTALEQAARKLLQINHIIHVLDDYLIKAKTEKACQQHLNAFLSLCSK